MWYRFFFLDLRPEIIYDLILQKHIEIVDIQDKFAVRQEQITNGPVKYVWCLFLYGGSTMNIQMFVPHIYMVTDVSV